MLIEGGFAIGAIGRWALGSDEESATPGGGTEGGYARGAALFEAKELSTRGIVETGEFLPRVAAERRGGEVLVDFEDDVDDDERGGPHEAG